MEGELGSPTGKPCNFGTTPSLVVAYVLVMSVWYPVEQGSDAEEEPRSSVALESIRSHGHVGTLPTPSMRLLW